MEVEAVIDGIVRHGDTNIHPNRLQSLKDLCRESENHLRHAFTVLWVHLHRQHAQIRVVTLQLIDELFNRSHLFRTLVLDDIPTLFENALGINGTSLPPPKVWASRLQIFASQCLVDWNNKFGDAYKQLNIAYTHLTHANTLNIQSLSTQSCGCETFQRRARRIELENQRAEVAYKTAIKLFEQKKDKLDHIIKETYDCFKVLVPDIVGDEIQHHDTQLASNDISSTTTTRTRLKLPSQYQLSFTINSTFQASPIHARTLKDLRTIHGLLTSRWTRRVNAWLKALEGFNGNKHDRHREILKHVKEFKEDVQACIERCEVLGVHLSSSSNEDTTQSTESSVDGNIQNSSKFADEDDDNDEEFEEVDVSNVVPQTQDVTPIVDDDQDVSVNDQEEEDVDDVQNQNEEHKEAQAGLEVKDAASKQVATDIEPTTNTVEFSNPANAHLYATAPEVPWGTDLTFWDASSLKFHNFSSGIERSHRFYGSSDGSNDISQKSLEQLRTRVVELEPNDYPTETKTCRAPLRNGGLCQRKDWFVCPVHGRIVERDDTGKIVHEKDRLMLEGEKDLFAPVDGKTFVMDMFRDIKTLGDLPGITVKESLQSTTTLDSKSKTGRGTKRKRVVAGLEVDEDSKLVDISKSSGSKSGKKGGIVNKIRKQMARESERRRRDFS